MYAGGYRKYSKSTRSRGGNTIRMPGKLSLVRSVQGAMRKTVRNKSYVASGYARDTETKFYDNYKEFTMSTTATALSGINYKYTAGPGGVNNISNVVQGLTAYQRIGNKINLKSIRCAFVAEAQRLLNSPNTTGGDGGYVRTSIRVCIVRDLQVNNSTNFIQWSDVFTNTGASSSTEIEISAPNNLANLGRFQILYDKTIQLDGDDPQQAWVYTLNLKNSELRFNGPSTTLSDSLQTKGLYLVTCARIEGDLTVLAGAQTYTDPRVGVTTRVAFVDA